MDFEGGGGGQFDVFKINVNLNGFLYCMCSCELGDINKYLISSETAPCIVCMCVWGGGGGSIST